MPQENFDPGILYGDNRKPGRHSNPNTPQTNSEPQHSVSENGANIRRGNDTTKSRPASRPTSTTRHNHPQARPQEVQTNFGESLARAIINIKNFFCSRLLHTFVSIVIIVLGVLLTISLISYINTGINDQSIIQNGNTHILAIEEVKTDNVGGTLGAKVSDILLNDCIGYSSFIFCAWIILLGLKILPTALREKLNLFKITYNSLLMIIVLSLLLGLVSLSTDSMIFAGGKFGYVISKYLTYFIGYMGTLALYGVLVLALVLLWLSNIISLFNKVKNVIPNPHPSYKNEDYSSGEISDFRSRKKGKESVDTNAGEVIVSDTPSLHPETPPHPQSAPVIQTEPYNEGSQDIEIIDLDELNGADATSSTSANGNNATIESELASQTPWETSNTMVANDRATTRSGSISEQVQVQDKDSQMEVTITQNEIEKGDATLTNETTIVRSKYDPRSLLPEYKFPSLDLLFERKTNHRNIDETEQKENIHRITETLNNYGIPIKSITACVGPTVTLFEIIPADGVRISKIKNLEDDIALSLSALGIRIIAPIPGRGTIGIEVPNRDPQIVSMRSILESKKFQECKYELPMAMGCTISKDVYIADLTKMPHLLVAGATGQGKSVGLNAIITSLLYRKHPAELKFVLIDPKMVEFSLYSRLKHHYLAKLWDDDDPRVEESDAIITDTSKVIATLNSLTIEMDNRYALLKDANVRNIKEYNIKFINRQLCEDHGHRYLPYIVVIVDEFSDLIMTAGKEVETPIARIAQKARAIGIHMIIATQRPSTSVITGNIKANFPGRIAFRVTQMVDSRTILDCPGAQQLIGRGDMLFLANGEMERVQCAFVDTPEVEAICESIESQMGYVHEYKLPKFVPESDVEIMEMDDQRDSLFMECAMFIASGSTASTSSLQRRFAIGYNRAGKIMDQLEAAGIVGAASGAKPRQVLMSPDQIMSKFSN